MSSLPDRRSIARNAPPICRRSLASGSPNGCFAGEPSARTGGRLRSRLAAVSRHRTRERRAIVSNASGAAAIGGVRLGSQFCCAAFLESFECARLPGCRVILPPLSCRPTPPRLPDRELHVAHQNRVVRSRNCHAGLAMFGASDDEVEWVAARAITQPGLPNRSPPAFAALPRPQNRK